MDYQEFEQKINKLSKARDFEGILQFIVENFPEHYVELKEDVVEDIKRKLNITYIAFKQSGLMNRKLETTDKFDSGLDITNRILFELTMQNKSLGNYLLRFELDKPYSKYSFFFSDLDSFKKTFPFTYYDAYFWPSKDEFTEIVMNILKATSYDIPDFERELKLHIFKWIEFAEARKVGIPAIDRRNEEASKKFKKLYNSCSSIIHNCVKQIAHGPTLRSEFKLTHTALLFFFLFKYYGVDILKNPKNKREFVDYLFNKNKGEEIRAPLIPEEYKHEFEVKSNSFFETYELEINRDTLKGYLKPSSLFNVKKYIEKKLSENNPDKSLEDLKNEYLKALAYTWEDIWNFELKSLELDKFFKERIK